MDKLDLEIVRCVGWDKLDEYKKIIKAHEAAMMAYILCKNQQ